MLMQSVKVKSIMLIVLRRSVIMLSVILLNVVMPWNHAKQSISNISRKQNVGLVTSSTILLHQLIIILSTSEKEKIISTISFLSNFKSYSIMDR
jgi:hypothetical protein